MIQNSCLASRQTKFKIQNKEQKIIVNKNEDYNFFWIGKNKDFLKTRIEILFNNPNLKSYIKIKVIADDQSQLDLEVLIRVEKGAKGTDTYLKMECLSLSEKAKIKIIPSLEILENEVKARHGATISNINKDYLYYLNSKGIETKLAKTMLINAFLKA